VTPSTVTDWRRRALTGISTLAVSLDTAVVSSSGNEVPAGIVSVRTVIRAGAGDTRDAFDSTRSAGRGAVRTGGAGSVRGRLDDVDLAAPVSVLTVELSLFGDGAG
jgi:hypothetical protein